MDTHNTRAGPGAQKVEQGPPSKAALPPDQPPRRDPIFFYANPLRPDSPTSYAPVSADLPGAGHDGASGGAPEALPCGTDSGRYEADGDPSCDPAQPPALAPLDGPDAHLGELPLGSVVYDSGWEGHSGLEIRTVFTAGPANGYLRDWVRELALRPRPLVGGDAGDNG